MVSLNLYTLEGINKQDFTTLFKNYNKEIGTIGDVVLLLNVENYQDLGDNIVNFKYQHDFEHSIKLMTKTVKYPFFHKAEIWILFKDKKSYLFIEGEEKSVKFIVSELEKLGADLCREKLETMKQIIIEQLNISSNILADILISDAVEITSQWFSKLGEKERTAFLSGQLKNRTGEESELYKKFKDIAKSSNTATFISEKLGYKITISKSKISSPDKESNAESIISFFNDIIIILF